MLLLIYIMSHPYCVIIVGTFYEMNNVCILFKKLNRGFSTSRRYLITQYGLYYIS